MKRVSALILSAALITLAGCDYARQREAAITDAQMKVHVAQSRPAESATPPAPAAPIEIIIDNNDAGFKSEGNWTSAEGGRDYKDETIWTANEPAASATWTPNIKVAGNYEVYEWHGEDPNSDHATNAPYTIKYDGGTANLKVDLTRNTGKWNLLGTYKFAAGTGGSITLTNKQADNNIIADAVRLVKVK